MNPVGAPFRVRVVTQTQMGFGHADGQLVKTQAIVECDLLFRLGRIFNARSAIHFPHDGFDLFLDAQIQGVEEAEFARLFASGDDRFAEGHGSGAALRPVIGHHRVFRPRLYCETTHQFDFRGRVVLEAIYGHHYRNAKATGVLHHLHQIRAALFDAARDSLPCRRGSSGWPATLPSGPPPCILSARMVATRTTQLGARPL